MRPETCVRTSCTPSRSSVSGRLAPTLPAETPRKFPRSLGRAIPVGLAISLACLGPVAQASSSVESILKEMDSAALTWRGMRASTEWVRYLSLVDDRSVESGRIAVRRSKAGAVTMLIEFQQPNRYFLSVRESKVERYRPRTKTVEVYDLSDSKEQIENAMQLGFGVSGVFLRQHYIVTLEGEEDVVGEPSVRLDLVPRNPKGKLNNRRLQMWISIRLWQPVRQKVYDLNPQDYRQQTYTDIELNPSFKSSEFRIPLARGTKRVRPQR